VIRETVGANGQSYGLRTGRGRAIRVLLRPSIRHWLQRHHAFIVKSDWRIFGGTKKRQSSALELFDDDRTDLRQTQRAKRKCIGEVARVTGFRRNPSNEDRIIGTVPRCHGIAQGGSRRLSDIHRNANNLAQTIANPGDFKFQLAE